MPRNFPLAFLLALPCALISITAQAITVPPPPPPPTTQRAFVSGKGDNLNVATLCAVTTPCKTFAGALPVVADKGEIVALDTAPYGSVTLAQNITISAAPGVYAGISVFAGAGITIATPGISVVLRGLTINGQGGDIGINMTNGFKLSIENCVIANFLNVTGVAISAAVGKVQIVNTLVRDSTVGVHLEGGAAANISASKFLGNITGIEVHGVAPNSVTNAAVSDTVVSGGASGINVFSTIATATNRISVTRSTIANNGTAITSESTTANALAQITLSDSMVTENTLGIFQSGAGASVKSPGNNTLSNNGTDVDAGSTLTVILPR